MRFFKLIAFLLLVFVLLCAFSFFTNKNEFGQWEITSQKKDTAISWARFYWRGDTLSGRYYDKVYMFIPAKLKDLPYTFQFQFDLGDPHTELYEANLLSVCAKHPDIKDRYQKLKGPLQFWNGIRSFKDLVMQTGDLQLSTTNCKVLRNFGDTINIRTATDTVNLGTIGADVFQNKVLVLDYPNQRFAICESLPAGFATSLVDMEFGEARKIVIPMIFNKKKYRITFDNGSSLFPLITPANNIGQFAKGPDVDTIRISSWGKYHDMTGRLVTDSFELAGRHFANVLVYANHSGLGIDATTDGVAGNALFWNNILVIDFKHKKFGVK